MNNDEQLKPKVLFKYRNDSERTEDIIIKQKIWLSSPSKLNDPLECRIGEIPKTWATKTIQMLEKGQLMGVLGSPLIAEEPKQLFSLSENETKHWVKRFKKSTHDKQVKMMRKLYSDHDMILSRPENIFKDMHKRLSEVGIFSLSETCSNELMWAHYGDNHAGIVFGFSISDGCKLANTRHCLPVTYAREKPTFKAGFKNELQIIATGSGFSNVQRVSFEDTVFRSAISTKTPAWEYEKEWRYVEENSGSFDFPGILTHVVFGMRMNEKQRAHYKSLINQYILSSVEYFEVVESKDLNGLTIRRVKVE